jgi:hypothetical protein
MTCFEVALLSCYALWFGLHPVVTLSAVAFDGVQSVAIVYTVTLPRQADELGRI